MFDGVPADQFHQFLAASSRTSLPIPLPFPLHHNHGVSIPPPQASAPAPPAPAAFLGCFDPYPSPLTLDVQVHEAVQQPNHHQRGIHHHQLHHQPPPPPPTTAKNNGEDQEKDQEEEGSVVDDPSWSNDEVLALLRLRSSMENWFPEFTWEHVSRKLSELGYHRNAEKCKEKFEEESRHFNSMSTTYNKNYRFFSDLDELYSNNDGNPQVSIEKNQDLAKENDKKAEHNSKMDSNSTLQEEHAAGNDVNPPDDDQENAAEVAHEEQIKSKKRKRKNKFAMFKGFCEAVVKKIVEQQEELHNKLIEDMVRRDEESVAREEAWKVQEMDRVNKEIEMRAQEQAVACDRQGKIIDLLKKFTSGSEGGENLEKRIEELLKVTNNNGSNSVTSSSDQIHLPSILNSDQTKLDGSTSSSMATKSHKNPTLLLSARNNIIPTSSGETTPSPQAASLAMPFQNPNNNSQYIPSSAQKTSRKPVSAPKERGERNAGGKRWPRDEVQALINLKCSLSTNSINASDESNKDLGAKGPLWERISQGMLELGYKRSSKRCKEKWENINKYFRKTKDNTKKRSLESRTCPYFQQLSTLYSQGTLVAPSNLPENRPENL